MRRSAVALAMVGVVLAAMAAADPADSLAAWREPRGEWLAAGAVSLDPADPKRFRIAGGSGVLVNGDAGRTTDLLTVEEHRDVRARLEFDVLFRAPRFDALGRKTRNARFERVTLNGTLIHENVEVTGPTRAARWEDDERPTGPLMLQGDHGPVAYRNVRLTPVAAE